MNKKRTHKFNLYQIKDKFFDKNFFKTFLNGVLSGIIAGIITGIVAGIIVGKYLFDYQNASEEKQYQRRMEREIAVFFEGIKYKISDLQSFNISSIKQPSDRLYNFAEAIKSYPLSFWYESSHKYKTELFLIISFQKQYLNFINTCDKLDTKIIYSIRKFNSINNAIQPNDIVIYKYFVGKLYKLPDAEILPFLDFNGIPTWVKEGYSDLNRNSEIRKIKVRYLFEENELNSILDTIKAKINI